MPLLNKSPAKEDIAASTNDSSKRTATAEDEEENVEKVQKILISGIYSYFVLAELI